MEPKYRFEKRLHGSEVILHVSGEFIAPLHDINVVPTIDAEIERQCSISALLSQLDAVLISRLVSDCDEFAAQWNTTIPFQAFRNASIVIL